MEIVVGYACMGRCIWRSCSSNTRAAHLSDPMQLCGLDQALMEAVRDELLFKRVARDEHRQGLVWRGERRPGVHRPGQHGRR